MASKTQEEYFGNYRGIVKKHGENGYCKIFFPSIYASDFETNIEKLPWAEPAMSLFAGGATINGTFQYPDIDATVWGFFEAGNINQPIFFAQTNNDKTKFVEGETTITYNNLLITLDSNNNSIKIKNTVYDGDITLDASIINMISQALNITNVHTISNISYKNEITCPTTKFNGSVGSSNGATGVNKIGNQFNEGVCTKL